MMCCEPYRHSRRGCCDDTAWEECGVRQLCLRQLGVRRWGAGYGPPPWAGSYCGWEFGPAGLARNPQAAVAKQVGDDGHYQQQHSAPDEDEVFRRVAEFA
jgi:hypothetical protein